MSKSLVDLLKEASYREKLIDALISGIPDDLLPAFNELINYVIDNKFSLFDSDELKEPFFGDDDVPQDLILPSVRRVFAKIFIDPPSLFKGSTEGLRYQLFVLYFNIDEFIDYLKDMIIKCKDVLVQFEHIDRTAETLTLIVDNYVASLVKKVRSCDDVETEIKNQKTIINRESSINEILNND